MWPSDCKHADAIKVKSCAGIACPATEQVFPSAHFSSQKVIALPAEHQEIRVVALHKEDKFTSLTAARGRLNLSWPREVHLASQSSTNVVNSTHFGQCPAAGLHDSTATNTLFGSRLQSICNTYERSGTIRTMVRVLVDLNTLNVFS